MSGTPPLVPLPGHSDFLIRIVPKSQRYHLKISCFVELYKQEEEGNILVGEKEVGSLSELLRAAENLVGQELRTNRPASSTIRAFITDYLSKYLFPEAQDEIASDVQEVVMEPILEDIRGIGPKTVVELRKKGITDIDQLVRAPEELLREEVKYMGDKRVKSAKNHARQLKRQDEVEK
ncbi:MAG: helix-hairpin-helix domain-containing protein [Candidatus Heimdallarchaeota archaeon]